MATLYDIHFSGELAEGFDRATVAANLATLFKANEETVDRLLSGQPQRLKRGLDKPGALKYKKALANAGAVITIKPAELPEEAPPETPSESKQQAVVDAGAGQAPADPTPLGGSDEPPVTTGSDGEMSLAPVGSDVLRDGERATVATVDVDTSSIQMESPFLEPEAIVAEPPPPAPDVSHLSTAEVGADIPTLATEQEEVNPDISHLDLDPEGSDFREVVQDDSPPLPAPDTDQFDLAPEGSDVLEEAYRDNTIAEAPDTDHIELEQPVP